MAGNLKRMNRSRRVGERVPLHSRIDLSTLDGKPFAPLACATHVGIGGVRVVASEGLRPGTAVRLAVQLPSGRIFQAQGRIAWLTTTLHLAPLTTPTGRGDDAIFGIAFDGTSTQDMMPIARLLAAREAERGRARRIRRLHNRQIHA